ncbi:MAG: glycosyl hydrolase [Bacteroidota bacterium]
MNTTRIHASLIILSFILVISPCLNAQSLVDSEANTETVALYNNMLDLSQEHILFGHQDALAYGVGWRKWHKRRSDVKEVSGKYPAVFGWEMSKLGKSPLNIDSVSFAHMKGWMKQAYKLGGVNEISWHVDNFVTGGDSWEVGEKVVSSILPGGEHHQAFLTKLNLFADFVRDLRVGFLKKRDIPIIFRPFHEHTGSWFWWGKDHCTAAEYKQLFRFTVAYLRDTQDLHNILYCYSPDIVESKEHYLERYPGDEYVDILGIDNYHDFKQDGRTEDMLKRLRIVVALAEEKGKVAALSETGLESIPDPQWWTEKVLMPIKGDEVASRIAWLMVWRNARKSHHYAPFPGHLSAKNFVEFSRDPIMLFAEDVSDIYRYK